jgi:hypothetical protein
MPSDSSHSGSSSNDDSHPCAWCCDDFQESTSIAFAPDLFCSRRCEIEARYWLFDQIQSAVLFRNGDNTASE